MRGLGKNNGNNNFGGTIIMTNGTITSMEDFGETILQAVKSYYSDGYRIEIRKVEKNNGQEWTALMIMSRDVNVAPTIYLEKFYEAYRKGLDMNTIIGGIMAVYEENKLDKDFAVDMITNFESVKDKICFKLVNKKRNMKMLENMVYIDYFDLAITFYIIAAHEERGNAVLKVDNNMLRCWENIDVKDLFEIAKSNTQRLFKAHITRMIEVMAKIVRDMTGIEDISTMQAAQMLRVEDEVDVPMYIASNENGVYGANVILYDGFLASFAEKIGSDFYILPSSVHELIFVPAKEYDNVKDLIDMVRMVNTEEVEPEDVLGDTIFLYHAKADFVEMK